MMIYLSPSDDNDRDHNDSDKENQGRDKENQQPDHREYANNLRI